MDPPGWGQLILNVQVAAFSDGPASDGKTIYFQLDELTIIHRRLVDEELQAPEEFPVVMGAVPLALVNPHREQTMFAGRYWLPPGEVQHIEVELKDAYVEVVGGDLDIHFPQQGGGWGADGAFDLEPVAPFDIIADATTGAIVHIDAGSGGDLSEYQGGLRLTPPLVLEETHEVQDVWYDENTLLVKFHSSATQTEIDDFYDNTNGEEVSVRPTGMRLVRFDPPPLMDGWAFIVTRMALYQANIQAAEPIISFASLNPTMTPPLDTERFDDYCWTEDNYHYLDTIGMEDAWDEVVSGSPVVGSREIIVGFVDTGIDINHPDLVDNLWVNEGELPSICEDESSFDFVDTFDLDGDGVFTLHDLNHPSSAPALSTALNALDDCLDYAGPGHLLNPAWDSGTDSGGPWPAEEGLYQGEDLLLALSDNTDNDSNGVEDDLFGAFFRECRSSSGCTVTNDVNPDDLMSSGLDVDSLWDDHILDLNPCDGSAEDGCGDDEGVAGDEEELFAAMYGDLTHGTKMASIVAAAPDNGVFSVGTAHEVRIAEARYASIEYPGVETTVAAIDYLAGIGAQIIVIETQINVQNPEAEDEAYHEKMAAEYESHPEVLFVVPAGNAEADCDEESFLCLYAETGGDNVISVANAVVTAGDLVELHTTSNFGVTTVHIAAPGELVTFTHLWDPDPYPISSYPSYDYYDSDESYCVGGSGTSSAGALVGGIAALVTNYCALRIEPFESGEDIKDAIIGLAADSSASPFSVPLDVIDSQFVQASSLVSTLCP